MKKQPLEFGKAISVTSTIVKEPSHLKDSPDVFTKKEPQGLP